MQALDAVKGGVAQKTFDPILTHVLIDGQTVMSFDSEIGIKVKLKADTGAKFNVSFNTLYNLTRALAEEDLDINFEGKKVWFRCGKHKSWMSQIEQEFPKPEVRGSNGWRPLPAGFKEALERCLLAASERESDKLLCNVLIKGAKLYSTDRRQVVRCTLPGMDLDPMLLSRKTVSELIRLGQPNRCAVAGPWSIWDYGNLTFLGRLREGVTEFPPVDTMMDKLGSVADKQIPEGMIGILTRLNYFRGESPEVSVVPSAMGIELKAINEVSECSEWLDLEQAIPAKKFNPEHLLNAVPFASAIGWGKANSDPIYLKGEAAGFEYLSAPLQ